MKSKICLTLLSFLFCAAAWSQTRQVIEKNAQASIHMFPQGGHGITLGDNPGSTELWPQLLNLWLEEKGFAVRKLKYSCFLTFYAQNLGKRSKT